MADPRCEKLRNARYRGATDKVKSWLTIRRLHPSILMRNMDGVTTSDGPDSVVVPKRYTYLNCYSLPRNMRWVEKALTYISRNTSRDPDMTRPMGAVLYVPMPPLEWKDVHP